MKKIMPNIAAIFFTLFGAGVIVLLASYTFQALAHIFPGNFVAQGMGMILFDIAAIAWLGAFIYLCKSVSQYAIAFIGFALGLAGTLGMVAIEVMLGGQQMIAPPDWVNAALIYGFIGSAVAHVILFYAYKIAAPEISADISLGIETANITEEAMKQAEAALLAQRNALGGIIAPRLINDVKRNLGLPVSGDVIDLPAYDIPNPAQAIPVQIPARKPSFLDRLKAAAQVFTQTGQPPVARTYVPPVAPAPMPQPEPETPPRNDEQQPAPVPVEEPIIHPNGTHPSP